MLDMRIKDFLDSTNREYETKRVITYNNNQTKAIYHNRKMINAWGNLYLGEVAGSDVDVYFYYSEVRIGIWCGNVDVDQIIGQIYDRFGTMGGFANPVMFVDIAKRKIADSFHFKFTEIELMVHICNELVPFMWKSREEYRKRYDDRMRADEEERKRNDEKFVKEKNDEANKTVRGIVEQMKKGGYVRNVKIQFYSSPYECKEYSIINYLMRNYNIKVPLKTQGWINKSLTALVVKNLHCDTYYIAVGQRPSKVFCDYMNKLLAVI